MSIPARREPLPGLEWLIREIKAAIASGDHVYQSAVVVRSADALTRRWSRLSPQDKPGFDRLLAGLLHQVDEAARITFAKCLTPLRRAPPLTTNVLACDQSIQVAGPLLEACPSFDEDWLLEIILACGDLHRCAVARRPALSSSLCDVLLRCESPKVSAVLLSNPGANITSEAVPTLMRMAARYENIAVALGARVDLQSSDRVKLAELARSRAYSCLACDAVFDEVASQHLLHAISQIFAAPVTPERAARFAGVAMIAGDVFGRKQVASARLERWIDARRVEDVLAALARDAGLPWMNIIACYDAIDPRGLAVVLRGLDHPWSVLKAVLRARHAGSISEAVLGTSYRLYADLSAASARRIAQYAAVQLGQSAFMTAFNDDTMLS